MNKSGFAVFFLMLFMFLITAPTVISAIDDSIDISCFYNITEEEETVKLTKGLNNYIINSNYFSMEYGLFKLQHHSKYYLKDYKQPFLNLVIPPPEFV